MKNLYNPYQDQKIVFFDGVCVLCNRSVDFLLKKDHRKRLKFASLQSEYAKNLIQRIKNQLIIDDTIIFYDEGKFFFKSTAVLRIAIYLGLPYSILGVFLVIPRPLRDWIYDLIARNRAKWFGTRERCRVPDQATTGRIIS